GFAAQSQAASPSDRPMSAPALQRLAHITILPTELHHLTDSGATPTLDFSADTRSRLPGGTWTATDVSHPRSRLAGGTCFSVIDRWDTSGMLGDNAYGCA